MKILLVFLFLFSSCITPQNGSSQKINPLVYYRHGLCFTYETGDMVEERVKNFFKRFKRGKYRNTQMVKEEITFCGTGVLPHMDEYKITFSSPNKMNFFVMRTCHEMSTSENPNSGILKKGTSVKITFKPTLERDAPDALGQACPLYVASYNRKQKHATAYIAFEQPSLLLEATIFCNGYEIEAKGVGVCSTRTGLLQKVNFKEPVEIGDPVNGPADRTAKQPSCPKLSLTQDKKSTGLFKLPNRECIYPFIGLETGELFQLHTIGDEGIIILE